MADDTNVKLERDEDIMQFINIGDDNVSDFDLSEDGGSSSIASSAEFKFETPDNYEFNNDELDYNWMSLGDHLGGGFVERHAFNGDYQNGAGHRQDPHAGNALQNLDMGHEPHQGDPSVHQSDFHSSSNTAPLNANHGMSSQAQDLLQKITFGAFDNPGYPSNPPELEHALLDNSESLNSKMQFTIDIDDFPLRSRVETQIKCRLTIRNAMRQPPAEVLLHLPSDTIARPRFQLSKPDQLKADMSIRTHTLWLSVEAINPDVPEEQILMCAKCLARERRRAFRKKAMDPHEETYWNGLQARRILIFNCREVVPINNDGQVELPLRIACYCRHHAAKNGYQLIFALRDYNGNLLARNTSSKVFITDSHKDQRRVSSAQNLPSLASNPTTPSSVSSSQESLPITSSHSTHMRRVSSASSLGLQQAHSVSSSPYTQPAQALQQSHHPYRRSSKPSSSIQSATSSNAGLSSTRVSGNTMAGASYQQLPSSQLSRQIQNLHAVPSWLAGVQLDDVSRSQQQQHQQHLQYGTQQQQSSQQQPQHNNSGPTIFRVIPHTGSVRGGIEVTLLGQNFQSGMVAMFGESQSINTQCWSDSTIIAQLPPSSQTGPVPVTFQGEMTMGSPPSFTYVNDGEDKLKEIALQMVGYKVTGKIEDAADIAQRIIMNDSNNGQDKESGNSANDGHVRHAASGNGLHASAALDQQENTVTESAEQLALWVLHNLNKFGSNRLTNVNLRNSEGQSMIHIASMLGYASVVKALIANSAYVDIQDVSGYTPLHFAVMFGNRNITRVLLMADADPFHRTLHGLTALDLADVTVEDLLPRDQRAWYSELNRRGSSSSIASMIHEWQQQVPNVSLLSPDNSEDEALLDESFMDSLNYRRPPSYSQIYPQEGSRDAFHRASVDGFATPNSLDHDDLSSSKFASDTHGVRQRNTAHVPVIDIEVSNSDMEEASLYDDGATGERSRPVYASSDDNNEHDLDDDLHLDNESQTDHNKSWSWTTKNQEIWNDKMLFTFWIPLSLVTLLGILTIYVIQNYGSSDASPMATKLGDMVAGFLSAAMDRIMPMPRWNQNPVYASRINSA